MEKNFKTKHEVSMPQNSLPKSLFSMPLSRKFHEDHLSSALQHAILLSGPALPTEQLGSPLVLCFFSSPSSQPVSKPYQKKNKPQNNRPCCTSLPV